MEKFARVLVGICFGTFALVSPVSAQNAGSQPEVEIDFDKVLEWKKPCAMTQELLESRIAPYETVRGSKLYWNLSNNEGMQKLFSPKFSPAYQPTYSFFKNSLKPKFVHFYWQGELMDHVNVIYSAKENEGFPPQLLADMDAAFGTAHAFNAILNSYEWNWANYSVSAKYTTMVGKGHPSFLIVVKRVKQPGETPPVASVTPPAMKPAASAVAPVPEKPDADTAQMTINLDEFIDWKTPMNLTVETFDAWIQALEKEAGRKLCRPTARENYQSRFFDPVSGSRGFKVRYSILDAQYYLKSAYVEWKNGEVLIFELSYVRTADGQETEPLGTIANLDKLFGCPHVVQQGTVYVWNTPAFTAVFLKYSNGPGYCLRLEQPRVQPVAANNPPPATPMPAQPSGSLDKKGFVLDLDPLVDWNDPFSLAPEKLDGLLQSAVAQKGGPLWVHSGQGESTSFGMGNYEVPKTLFSGRLKVRSAYAIWREPRVIDFVITPGTPADEEWLYAKLDATLEVTRRRMNLADPAIVAHEWMPKNYRVVTSRLGDASIRLTIARAGGGFNPVSSPGPLAANLDALLNFSSIWTWTASDFEKSYTPKAAKKEDQKKPQQFDWLNSAKDRARFSRQMDSETETKLTMFGGSIKLEEAVLEFVNGRAARATISFYNRGDSGDIEVKEFDRMFKLIGQNLTQVMKVAPKRQIMSSNSALPVTGWLWTSPNGVALLEYTEYDTPGKLTKPEFLRLKLATPTQADWSMGKLATGVQRMELLKRVTKTPEGDVYITGVPMVDQGAKGYCVAASCQRLFEYMRIPCDQHEMAKLVGIDAEGGADVSIMIKSLAKIDGAFKVTFKPLVNPEQYYSTAGKRRVSEKEFISLVKEYVDKGVPLLWGLALGEKPEDPPLPGGGQVRGGHMRMVIGYNAAKNKILFTDSWGAGHELKRMSLYDAYDVTLGLFSMAPRGL